MMEPVYDHLTTIITEAQTFPGALADLANDKKVHPDVLALRIAHRGGGGGEAVTAGPLVSRPVLLQAPEKE